MHPFGTCSGFLIPPCPTFPQAPHFIPDGRFSQVRLAILTLRSFFPKGPSQLRRNLSANSPYSSTPARDSSRIDPVDLFRCPSRPRAPLLLEGITLPSSLIQAHASDQNPPLGFALRYSQRSLQVTVSPCWKLALPDIISVILAWLLRPLSRGVSPVLLPVSTWKTSASP